MYVNLTGNRHSRWNRNTRRTWWWWQRTGDICWTIFYNVNKANKIKPSFKNTRTNFTEGNFPISNQNLDFNLPKLNWPTFSRSYQEWSNFKDMLTSNYWCFYIIIKQLNVVLYSQIVIRRKSFTRILVTKFICW